MNHQTCETPLDRIPTPVEVRERLAVALREVRLLRRLLKVSEEKHGKAQAECQPVDD